MDKKIKLLNAHQIKTEQKGNRLFAESVVSCDGRVECEWIDVTEWSFQNLLTWLGY